jgi:hypothetical protein
MVRRPLTGLKGNAPIKRFSARSGYPVSDFGDARLAYSGIDRSRQASGI